MKTINGIIVLWPSKHIWMVTKLHYVSRFGHQALVGTRTNVPILHLKVSILIPSFDEVSRLEEEVGQQSVSVATESVTLPEQMTQVVTCKQNQHDKTILRRSNDLWTGFFSVCCLIICTRLATRRDLSNMSYVHRVDIYEYIHAAHKSSEL